MTIESLGLTTLTLEELLSVDGGKAGSFWHGLLSGVVMALLLVALL